MASADVETMPSASTVEPSSSSGRSGRASSSRPSSSRPSTSNPSSSTRDASTSPSRSERRSRSRSKGGSSSQPAKTYTSDEAMTALSQRKGLGWSEAFESDLVSLASKVTASNEDTQTYARSKLRNLWSGTFKNKALPKSLIGVGKFDESKVDESVKSQVDDLYTKGKEHSRWANMMDTASGDTYSTKARKQIDKHLMSTIAGKKKRQRRGTTSETDTATGQETYSNPASKKSAKFSDNLYTGPTEAGESSRGLKSALKSKGGKGLASSTNPDGSLMDPKQFQDMMAKYASTKGDTTENSSSGKTTLDNPKYSRPEGETKEELAERRRLRKEGDKSMKTAKREMRKDRLGADSLKQDTAAASKAAGHESRKDRKRREHRERRAKGESTKDGTTRGATSTAGDTTAGATSSGGETATITDGADRRSKALQKLREMNGTTAAGSTAATTTPASTTTGAGDTATAAATDTANTRPQRPRDRDAMIKQLHESQRARGIDPTTANANTTNLDRETIKKRIEAMKEAKAKGGGGNYQMVDSSLATSNDNVYTPGRMMADDSGMTVRKKIEDKLKEMIQAQKPITTREGDTIREIPEILDAEGNVGKGYIKVDKNGYRTEETVVKLKGRVHAWADGTTSGAPPTQSTGGSRWGGIGDKVSSLWGGNGGRQAVAA